MAKVYVIANLFLLTKNDIIVHYNKFPNLGFYHTNFFNLKGPRAPSQNCKKKKKIPASFNLYSSRHTAHLKVQALSAHVYILKDLPVHYGTSLPKNRYCGNMRYQGCHGQGKSSGK